MCIRDRFRKGETEAFSGLSSIGASLWGSNNYNNKLGNQQLGLNDCPVVVALHDTFHPSKSCSDEVCFTFRVSISCREEHSVCGGGAQKAFTPHWYIGIASVLQP